MPDSDWSQPRAQWRAERSAVQVEIVPVQPYVVDFVAQSQAASSPRAAEIFKAIEGSQRNQENDLRSRIESLASQLNITPLQLDDYELSAETLAGLAVSTEDIAGTQRQSGSSTAATAATILQQDSGSACCILPPCAIL